MIAGAGVGYTIAQADSQAPEAKRQAMAAAKDPRGAKGRTLGLSRVVVPPGVELPLHHHEGTQIARIRNGVLNYTVHSGKAKVFRGQADGSQRRVATIKAGQTRKLRRGEWLIEQPSDHHSAANRGTRNVVIYLATLLRNGAPASTPLER